MGWIDNGVGVMVKMIEAWRPGPLDSRDRLRGRAVQVLQRELWARFPPGTQPRRDEANLRRLDPCARCCSSIRCTGALALRPNASSRPTFLLLND